MFIELSKDFIACAGLLYITVCRPSPRTAQLTSSEQFIVRITCCFGTFSIESSWITARFHDRILSTTYIFIRARHALHNISRSLRNLALGADLGIHRYRLHYAALHCFYSRQLSLHDSRTWPDLVCTRDDSFHASRYYHWGRNGGIWPRYQHLYINLTYRCRSEAIATL